YAGDVDGTLYTQYFAETYYTDASRYSSQHYDFGGWYSGPLEDLQTIIDLNSNPDTQGASYVLAGGSNANQLAVANILKAYYFHTMTDRWGPIPYSEALKGGDNYTPAYDSQKSIYMDLISKLKAAVNNMDSGQGVTGDYIFNGDMGMWTKFANTLRARIALRMSEVDPSTAETEFKAAYNDGLITEDVMYPYLSDDNNDNPWQDRFQTRTDYAITKFMADTMKSLGDQRVLKYADPAEDLDNGDGVTQMNEIVGMPYGLSKDDAAAISYTAVSFPGHAIRSSTSPLPVMTMAEVNFMLAEATQRGWISTGTTAAQYYQMGIKASMQQWGTYDAATFANYMSQSEVAYDPANWKQKIGFQKWLALFPQGYESWSEWRRLGYPVLTPAPAGAISQIPVRQGYPESESELNSDSYNKAVDMLGGNDNLTTNLWWDK
ncbi:MAG TPA: SusD/RagB family nutrient-binding outer membrane lipoprotein, partial [Balneolaceae bacterium]|nr:SusD/RagB family nutrient-binding outer membrane lipoprotein [Balneolaceae bacterium]